MKKLLISLAVISFASVNLAANAFGGPGGEPPKHGHMQKKDFKKFEKKMAEQIKKDLGLTDEQSEKAKAMRKKSREEIKPLFEKMREEHYKMREMEFSKATDEELKKQWDKIFVLKKKIRKIHKQNLKDFESILTDEQKEKFEKIKEQKKAEHKKRRQNRKNRRW